MEKLNRKWMYERLEGRLLKKEFTIDVREFIEFAKQHRDFQESSKIICPCSKCKNVPFLDVESVREHLYKKGFLNDYYEWVCHGEDFDSLKASDEPSDPYVDMIIDAFGQVDGDPMHEDIRNEFDKKAGDRLRGTLNQVFKMALHKQVSFMTDTVRAEFINKRKHPDFVKRSNQARDNRLSGQTLEKFDPGHRQGSISTPQVVKKMAKKKDGILPTATEVYESTHSVWVGNDEVELMGDKSQKKSWENIWKNLRNIRTKELR
ncbi:uncharacterized protein LOC110700020 isoform X3 [Chenopodium quinoa]|uniref:uncharacterized protein LOC110700020 isoform X3 n=1 Tax=Chenopodium quinoa TaxID=63459 RepID=UPI000B76FBC0|nr:uncharacterized protein LOC110700020 isoform X3 [Chenopodium quinoa]